ncbi:NAD(P)/FAD-dependent oxidoreductase [Ramlibacter sp. H39-3-26]|uniref:NAD(P)/FAD-dependent oxidoreductase n=1 Tax=Curvibacter soli TaxID=3031331 RepID=UPI0023D97F3E|nr:NAD(P)/FAD-dependent oxidoreductase [Ramlibacter sp. H39-3-26]MDF1485163.1 NAD(P)/FAD-dependent oxidoreductase [Ramlibacter sp. H39-3-26]
MAAAPAPIETDAAVIGAGPAGLFQVFQLGLHGIRAHVIDALPHAGGQCAELYPDKPIYDIPALPFCTGQELAERLQRQAAPFAPVYHLGQEVAALAPQADGRLLLETMGGTRLLARTVVIAAGVGAFVPRALPVPQAEAFVRYHLDGEPATLADWAGQPVAVYGDDDVALERAFHLADAGAHVTLLYRREVLQAAPHNMERLAALRAAGRIHFIAGQVTGHALDASGQLAALRVTDAEGTEHALPARLLLAWLGLSPRLGPLAHWGLAMERKQLAVDAASFATSLPGVFAVGDVVTYPGKRKLILCAFHEAALAAFSAAEHLRPGEKIALQYTTTSTHLHALLGVASPQHGTAA